MAKDNPNLVRECYTHDTGGVPDFDQRAFMDWCEKRVHEWKAMVDRMGLDWPRWTIPEDYHGKKTYHDWLKERVGL